MDNGYAGRIGIVNLSKAEVKEEKLDESMARDFVGGFGLGARIMFERQRGGVDPLGPENTLGFTTGPLTGTPTPTGGRHTVVCKSPLTGGWGDANAGGNFGAALKAAGWDAIFVTGVSSSPQYLLVTNDGLQLRDATHLWGKDTVETEDALAEELGEPTIRVACIGPASENLCLITGIVNDKGRIAARSGVGAVMGSKRLKAVAVHGTGQVAVADSDRLGQLRRSYAKLLRESPNPVAKAHGTEGTCGYVEPGVHAGATPIKNWSLAGDQAFPTVEKVSADSILKYQVKKYTCANCPVACGGTLSVPDGPYPIAEMHKPEYETIAALGPLCLNDDVFSILKVTDMCNRSGLDTISTGAVIAFAMECFENGLITLEDTDGIALNWGDAASIVAMTDKIVRREGFGDVLADGVEIAAQKIGGGAEQYAVHVGGQDPGMHNALYLPGRGTGYVCDATPGRHTAAGASARVDLNATLAPYPELQFSGFERLEYKTKGPSSATASSYWQVGSCAGLCLFAVIFHGDLPTLDFLNAVTGWDLEMKDALETGARIQTIRQCFNIREGIEPSEMRLPDRMRGVPPKAEGPLAGVTIDIDRLANEHRKAMGYNPDTGHPTDATLKRLGLKELVEKYG